MRSGLEMVLTDGCEIKNYEVFMCKSSSSIYSSLGTRTHHNHNSSKSGNDLHGMIINPLDDDNGIYDGYQSIT